jgi:hypothetical protein
MPSRSVRPKLATMGDNGRWDVNESRSVRSGWIWRGFFLLSLVAIGIAIILASNHYNTLAIGWGIIAGGWFVISMFLWRKHTQLDQ